jgi:hypothetical protein
MGVTTTQTNKPFNPRGNDQSPKGYNRAALYSGKALDFDGVNDYVDGGTLDITAYTQMSVSFYMNVDTTTQDFRLISIRYSGADDIRIFHSVSIGGGVLNFSLDDGDVDNIGVNFETNEWYHVVMTHDGTTLKAYFNGIEQASTASTFDYANADGLFYIGRYTGGSVTFYDGEASNFKIFNTALTAAQVADLYNNPEKVVPTGVDNTALKLWLPMMEGAGTTAYDGSGNGNHGTISGATYVNGIGAPVAQTAVMDWNKGTNLLQNSEGFNSWITYTGASVDTNTTIAPDGQTTADTLNFASGNESLIYQNYGSGSATFTLSVWAKSSTNKKFAFRNWNGTSAIRSNEFTTSNEWQRFEYTFTQPLVNIGISNEDNGSTGSIEIWGASLEQSATAGPYVRTGATAQTSEVLLPQGLTTGRDITGVNLFENVRKQGALNLDGNSWAEVHDNASIDLSDCSLEAWVCPLTESSNLWETIFVKTSQSNMQILIQNNGLLTHYSLSSGVGTLSYTTFDENQWNHFVIVQDGANLLTYVNSVLESSNAIDIAMENAGELYIGAKNNVGEDPSYAQIAQPRIYNRALTAEEVQRNYNAGKNTYTN